MKKTSRSFFKGATPLLMLLAFSAPNAFAAEKATVSGLGQASTMNLGEDPGPVYIEKVKQWADITKFAKNAADVAVGKLKLDMQSDPKLQKVITPEFISDLEQFFYQLFASQETMVDLAKLYSQYFTLDEMQELINFYKTTLGEKLIKSNSELMLKSQQIGINLLKKHEHAYMKVVEKYIKPIQEENAKKK